MLSREENEILTRVGPETPMGTLMRRYWIPAFRSDELTPSGDPKRVRLLGENLVAYRDADGNVGLLDEACPHRGASLALGRADGCGIRCLYHGWVIGVDGTVLETPAEPDEHAFKERIRARHYPVQESGGIAWAYLGEPGTEPELQEFEFCGLPAEQVLVMKARVDCNYAQVVEGVLDSSHSDYLHSDSVRFLENQTSGTLYRETLDLDRPSRDGKPRIEVENTAFGFRYAAVRKPLSNADENRLVRMTLWAAPFYGIFPAPTGWGNMQAMVPIDDETTMFYFIKWRYENPITAEEREQHAGWSGLRVGPDIIDATTFGRRQVRTNNWQQDRAKMRSGESFTGISGVNIQDFAVEESMGPIYDRTKEHLGASDAAVARMRRRLIDAARGLAKGEEPPGLGRDVEWGKLRAQEATIRIDDDWRDVLSSTVSEAPVVAG